MFEGGSGLLGTQLWAEVVAICRGTGIARDGADWNEAGAGGGTRLGLVTFGSEDTCFTGAAGLAGVTVSAGLTGVVTGLTGVVTGLTGTFSVATGLTGAVTGSCSCLSGTGSGGLTGGSGLFKLGRSI